VTVLRFRLFGFPIGVSPFFWVLALILGLGVFEGVQLAIWVGVVFVSILWHELGHAFVARAAGEQEVHITLHGFGGLTRFGFHGRPIPPGWRLAITLAGPIFGFALAGAAWVLLEQTTVADDSDALRMALGSAAWANFVWSIFNLIPIRGLDGGQAVGGITELVVPNRARLVAEVIYIAAGLGAAIYGFVSDYLILAFVALFLTFGSYFSGQVPDPAAPAASDEADDGQPSPERDPEPPTLPL
jgi:Zn-dependent protease